MVDARARSDVEVRAARELSRDAAQGSRAARACMRSHASVAGAARCARPRAEPVGDPLGARGLRVPARLGTAARGRTQRGGGVIISGHAWQAPTRWSGSISKRTPIA